MNHSWVKSKQLRRWFQLVDLAITITVLTMIVTFGVLILEMI